MNNFSIDTIKVGESASFERTITIEMMDAFLMITGDNNPLHINADYAKSKGFVDRVCYGALTSSMLSTLAGVYLPGEKCLLHSIESKFKLPVYIGDTLLVEGTVSEVNEMFKEITIKARILNQNGKTVLRAVVKAGILDEENN